MNVQRGNTTFPDRVERDNVSQQGMSLWSLPRAYCNSSTSERTEICSKHKCQRFHCLRLMHSARLRLQLTSSNCWCCSVAIILHDDCRAHPVSTSQSSSSSSSRLYFNGICTSRSFLFAQRGQNFGYSPAHHKKDLLRQPEALQACTIANTPFSTLQTTKINTTGPEATTECQGADDAEEPPTDTYQSSGVNSIPLRRNSSLSFS